MEGGAGTPDAVGRWVEGDLGRATTMVGARVAETEDTVLGLWPVKVAPHSWLHPTHGEDVVEIRAIGQGQGGLQHFAREVPERQHLADLAVQRGLDMQSEGLLVDGAATAGDRQFWIRQLTGAAVAEVRGLEQQRHRSTVDVHTLLIDEAGVVEVQAKSVPACVSRLRGHLPRRLGDQEEAPGLQRRRPAQVGGVCAQRVRIRHSRGVGGPVRVGFHLGHGHQSPSCQSPVAGRNPSPPTHVRESQHANRTPPGSPAQPSGTRRELIQRTVPPLASGTSWPGPSCNNYIQG